MRIWAVFFIIVFSVQAKKADEAAATSLGFQFKMIQKSSRRPPIFQAGKLIKYAPGAVALEYDRSLREVLNEIEAKESSVVLDCTLFVQVAAIILAGRIDYPGFFLDPMGAGMLLANSKITQRPMTYLAVKDRKALGLLQQSSLLNKGQWLLPLGDDRYLGLSNDGPLKASEEVWTARVKKSLFEEIAAGTEIENRFGFDCELSALIESASKSIGWILHKQGRLDDWELKSF